MLKVFGFSPAAIQIERYRQKHGVKDQGKVFGPEAKGGGECARQEAAQRRLRGAQRTLGHEQQAGRARMLGRILGSVDRDETDPDLSRLKHRECGRQPPAGVGRKRP